MPKDDILIRFCSALGHPLGCTGARQVVTALSELRRQDKRIAVTSMCVGTVSAPYLYLCSLLGCFQTMDASVGIDEKQLLTRM